jgi:hypothetical protein
MTHGTTISNHAELVAAALPLVRAHGPAAALDVLLSTQPQLHVTCTTFTVWAIDRLLSAGRSTASIVSHPLLHEDSPRSWWDADTLDGVAARTGWVEPNLGEKWEPRPYDPRLVAAA